MAKIGLFNQMNICLLNKIWDNLIELKIKQIKVFL